MRKMIILPYSKEEIEKETQKARIYIAKARARLLMAYPFYGYVAMSWELQPMYYNTAATDGPNLYYNPFWINKLNMNELVGLVAHEAEHVILKHMFRMFGRDHERWNIACDIRINLDLQRDGFTLPKSGVAIENRKEMDTMYGTMAAEQIYDNMPEDLSSILPQGGSDGDGEMWGAVLPLDPTMSAEEKKQIETEVGNVVTTAAERAVAMGKGHGTAERYLDSLKKHRVPWEEELTDFMRRALYCVDYTYANINKRFAYQGLYLPGPLRDNDLTLALFVDISGSMGQPELDLVGAEINGVCEEAKPSEVHVCYFDDGISGWETYERDDEIKLTARGGGGTDFVPPMEEMERRGIEPDCIIYLTDMFSHSFPSDPGIPTLWVSVGTDRIQPPFGKLLMVPKEDIA